MTTRKELIERIQAMQLGTQEMLDAAADDACLIPFETLFVDVDTGYLVLRIHGECDDLRSVRFIRFEPGTFVSLYRRASQLTPPYR